MDPGEPRREFGLSGQGGSNGFAPMVVIVIMQVLNVLKLS
jgi:hypothetical protein